MDLQLSGKLALITGGSQGIGLAIAEQLADEGVNLILAARNLETLKQARQALVARYPVSVSIFATDLGLEPNVQNLAAQYPDIDILVNNAGAIGPGSLEEVDGATWRSYWDLKVFGYINLTRAYYLLMKERRRGVIVNIIGAAGERPDPAYIAGSTANAALIAFTKALGSASTAHGVRVVGLNPGPVLTEKLKRSLRHRAARELGEAERWPELTVSMPFGRTIRPIEVSAMVAMLASELSGYISGTTITIDGGRR